MAARLAAELCSCEEFIVPDEQGPDEQGRRFYILLILLEMPREMPSQLFMFFSMIWTRIMATCMFIGVHDGLLLCCTCLTSMHLISPTKHFYYARLLLKMLTIYFIHTMFNLWSVVCAIRLLGLISSTCVRVISSLLSHNFAAFIREPQSRNHCVRGGYGSTFHTLWVALCERTLESVHFCRVGQRVRTFSFSGNLRAGQLRLVQCFADAARTGLPSQPHFDPLHYSKVDYVGIFSMSGMTLRSTFAFLHISLTWEGLKGWLFSGVPGLCARRRKSWTP